MKTGKRLLSVLLSLMLVLGTVALGGMTVSADDDGIAWNEAENRYEISSYAGLKKFADIVNGIENPDELLNPQAACAKLMNDIDASASDPGLPGYDPSNAWTPIVNDNDNRYTGIFDGDGHVITGLTFDDSYADFAGFFGKVSRVKEGDEIVGGIVKNVGIEDGKITGSHYVGGVVGFNTGLITGCYFKGAVSGNEEVGGVVGLNDGTIENCYNTGAVSGNDFVGGVTGYSDGGTVRNCFNTGAVSGNDFVGGVVGKIINICSITSCYNTGDVSGNGKVGGVVGSNADSTVSNCYTTGTINPGPGASKIGVIAGFCEGINGSTAKVKNCYYDSDKITGFSEIGEKRGEVETSSLAGLTTADMTGLNALDNMVFVYEDGEENPWLVKENNEFYSYYPHLKGFNFDENGNQLPAEDIRKADWPACTLKADAREISNYAQLKEFASEVNSGSFSLKGILTKDIVCKYDPDDTEYAADWTSIGNLNIDYTGIFDGDGYVITGLTFDDSSAECVGLFGTVVGVKEGDEFVGGIVKNVGIEDGKITGSQYVGGVVGFNAGLITGCYFKGAVSCGYYVGGIAGINNYGTVENCYNTGEVSGDNYIGGVTGYNYGGTVRNCFNTGKISGNWYIGGVVGGNVNTSIITNCYNTGDVSGADSVGGVTGFLSNNAVSNCYTTGNINPGTGASDIGIIVGYCEGINGGTAKVKNCYYDSDKITDIPEIGGKRESVETSVAGLTTAQMTGENALRNMVFEYGDGEASPWLTKANGADVNGKYRLFYPHLKGFDYDLTAASEDWPAKVEITVGLSDGNSCTYDGEKHGVYVTVGDSSAPEDATVTYSQYKYSNENNKWEWKEISGTPTETGKYRMEFDNDDGVVETKYYTILAPVTDYTVKYYAKDEETGTWSTDTVTPVDAGNYKAVLTFTDTGYLKGQPPIVKEFTIDRVDVTVTAASEEFTYDGRQHSNNGYEVTGLVGSDAITAVVTGSITYPSDSPVDNVVESYEFTTGSPDNYNVTTVNGELTMTNASVAITITAASKAWIYDGNAHSDNTVMVTSGELLTGDTLVATATGSVTNVSDTAEGNNQIAEDYKIMHGDVDVTANYTITAVPGTLTINPAGVTVTIKGNSAEADYDGSEHIASGYTATADNDLYKIDEDMAFSGTAEAKRTEPGTESMGLDAGQFTNTNTNFDVTFEVEEDGILTVNPVVKFVNEDGKELQSGAVALGTTPGYTGETPQKEKDEWFTYEFDKWTPDIAAANENATYTASFTPVPIEYTATFVDENGNVIGTTTYTVNTEKLDEPEVPAKEGYEGAWEEYELGAGNITIKPVYTPTNICKLDGKYHGDTFWGKLVTFVHNLIWTAFSFIGLDLFFSIKRV
ncbi:MAG: hypothetical protein IJM02_03420 [Clostridia bacterium]|nr:hypothetical protein [Clostridia bacterium]